MPDPVNIARYRALMLAALGRQGAPSLNPRSRVLVVDAARQRLGLLEGGRLVFEAVISTAKNGLGCEEGSYRTPTGWHRIHDRIGAGAEPGTVFRNRVAAGEVWRGEIRSEDLILTRVLTLDGLEDGCNRGPGVDSLERFIYLHGTNQEGQLGLPVSHGCVRLSNVDVACLFDLLSPGDPVLIAGDLQNDGLGLGRLHFAGVAGSGMSALAQFVAMKGGHASGSDRSFDRGQRPEERTQLEALGVTIHSQNGAGLEGDCSALIVSTAVEEEVPDVAAARRLGVPVLHRSELLAHLVARYRTVAVTGTSGKSTTVAMVFEILRGVGRDPSVITGGELVALQREGLWGNAWVGRSDILVIEADESDGSVVRYHPAVGVVLNLQRDHKEMDTVAEMFRVFRAQVREAIVLGQGVSMPMRIKFDALGRGNVPKNMNAGFSKAWKSQKLERNALDAIVTRWRNGGNSISKVTRRKYRSWRNEPSVTRSHSRWCVAEMMRRVSAGSGSQESLAKTSMAFARLSSSTVAVSLFAVGGSATGLTVTETVVLEVRPSSPSIV